MNIKIYPVKNDQATNTNFLPPNSEIASEHKQINHNVLLKSYENFNLPGIKQQKHSNISIDRPNKGVQKGGNSPKNGLALNVNEENRKNTLR